MDGLQAQVTELNRLQAESAAELERLSGAVLKQAFRGELVPQDPDDEPASVLLEQIRTERERKDQEKRARQMRLPGA